MKKLNKRLTNFYIDLGGIYPTIKVKDTLAGNESLTFMIDYEDINHLSLIPIMKLANHHKLSITQINVEIQGTTKYMVGTVKTKDISVQAQASEQETENI